MDEMLKLFEKALADYHAALGKKDTLVGSGEILIKEFRKMRENNITLGQLLADFYAQERQESRRVHTLNTDEEQRLRQQQYANLLNQRPPKGSNSPFG